MTPRRRRRALERAGPRLPRRNRSSQGQTAAPRCAARRLRSGGWARTLKSPPSGCTPGAGTRRARCVHWPRSSRRRC